VCKVACLEYYRIKIVPHRHGLNTCTYKTMNLFFNIQSVIAHMTWQVLVKKGKILVYLKLHQCNLNVPNVTK